MTVGALVLPPETAGKIEASTTRSAIVNPTIQYDRADGASALKSLGGSILAVERRPCVSFWSRQALARSMRPGFRDGLHLGCKAAGPR